MLDVSASALLISFGIYSSYRSWQELHNALASTSWPQAPGVILCSENQVTKEDEYEVATGIISYQYEVMGKTYLGKRVFYGDLLGLRWQQPTKLRLARYPTGKTLPVRYNPDLPNHAVLEPGPNWITYLSLFIPVTIAVWAGSQLLWQAF